VLIADRYQMTELLGEGGMARVYRAYDRRLKVWRAVKLLDPKLAGREKLRVRFEAEAQTMASLEHVNIVRVYDAGFEGEAPYIVMELIEGGSPADWLDRYGAMPSRLALTVCAQICMGLFHAHARGIVHRDIKPHNVLVTAQGLCKVSDFGIARLTDSGASGGGMTKTGSVMGTLGFMAPEQRTDAKSVDARADIYAIGATLYMLITNEVPIDLFAATQDDEMLASVPEELRPVIRRATAYRREDRYGSAHDLAAAMLKVRQAVPPDPSGTPSLVLQGPRDLPPETPTPAPEPAPVVATQAQVEDPIPVAPAMRWKNLPGDAPCAATPSPAPPRVVEMKAAPVTPPPPPKDTGPRVDFDVAVPTGPRLIVHLECDPKRVLGNGRPLEGTIAIQGMLGERRLQAALAAAAKAASVPAERAWCWHQGRGAFREHVSFDDLSRRTAALEEHSDACNTCTARADARAFGCIVQVPSFISAAAETWLMGRLQDADKPGGQLAVQMLKDSGVIGQGAASRRAEGQFEMREPIVRVVKQGWLFNTRISSDEIFEAIVYPREGESVDPPIALCRLLWFGAVRSAVAPDAELEEKHVDQLLAIESPVHRKQRTVLQLGPTSDDYCTRTLQRVLQAMYLAWTHDVRLLVEV
jgi:serine/threonine protein kinase